MQRTGSGGWSQSIRAPLHHSFLLTLFPCPTMGSSRGSRRTSAPALGHLFPSSFSHFGLFRAVSLMFSPQSSLHVQHLTHFKIPFPQDATPLAAGPRTGCVQHVVALDTPCSGRPAVPAASTHHGHPVQNDTSVHDRHLYSSVKERISLPAPTPCMTHGV